MNERDLQQRTKAFALRAMRLADSLPSKASARSLASQLCRSACSVGANYRAACKARSKAEFIAKLGIVEEEADECQYWLELVIESGMMKPTMVKELYREAVEITAIIAASKITARSRK